ncbi:TPA: restriction endonuclease subunit S [Streptococcus suis]
MVDDRKIPEGYKVTEAGVIPDDWDSLNVKDLVSFSGGSQPPKSTFRREKRPGYIRLIQIRDYKNDDYLTFIPEMLANKKCSADDIMIGRYGPPIFQILRGIDGAYNVALMKALPNEKLEKEYLYYFLKQESLFRFIELLSRRSSGQTGVDLVALREYPFPLPPLQEQKAIAEALSDTDSLIQSVEKLIKKKKKIKQGAMQQLLTGEKRLPGFSGEWEHRNVESFGEIITGGTPPTGVKAYWNGSIPWVTPTDITSTKNIYTTDRKITNTGLSKLRKLPKNSVLITCIASIGKNAVIKKDGACNQQINAIIPSNGYDSDFLYYLFESNKSYLLSNAGITATNIISKKDFALIEFLVPKLDEQKAIAQVLSDMDAEIEALEEKLEKYKTIKQGMMQELLTGRIRLI